jgi:ATP-dependent Clp protease ATP-binding subunit ClpA
MTTTSIRPFTSRTRVALAIARAVAAGRGDDDLTPTHLAIGIFRELKNPGVAALYGAGIEASVLQYLATELESSLGEAVGTSKPRQIAIDVTPGETAVIARAEKEAELLNDQYVGTEHILLAILATPAEPCAAFLAQRGITEDVMRRGISSGRAHPTG